VVAFTILESSSLFFSHFNHNFIHSTLDSTYRAMPTKPKVTISRAAFDAKVLDWSKRLWSAVSKDPGKYSVAHEEFYREFIKIRDDTQALNISAVTMVNHVAPIYNNIASQGYKAHIHFPPLKEAVANYCEGKPVIDWKAPPEFRLSPSPSSSSLPSSPPVVERKEEPPRKSNAGPKKKGKGKADERSEHEESEKESAKPREGEPAKLRKPPLPNTEGMEQSPTRCFLCEQRGHACYVNPKATKTAAACFECNHWRLKCSLAPIRAKKGEAPVEEEEVAASKESAPKEPAPKEPVPKRRKKPTQVPAGQPGQLTSEV
jgi:hypothetical protein